MLIICPNFTIISNGKISNHYILERNYKTILF